MNKWTNIVKPPEEDGMNKNMIHTEKEWRDFLKHINRTDINKYEDIEDDINDIVEHLKKMGYVKK